MSNIKVPKQITINTEIVRNELSLIGCAIAHVLNANAGELYLGTPSVQVKMSELAEVLKIDSSQVYSGIEELLHKKLILHEPRTGKYFLTEQLLNLIF